MKIFLKNCHYSRFLFLLLLLLTECFSSCKKDEDIDWSNIDISNIENLYEQPLPVIKKCVQGKWKWTSASRYPGYIGYYVFFNTFVEITEKNVVITSEEKHNDFRLYNTTFSYDWKKMKTLPSSNPFDPLTTVTTNVLLQHENILWQRKQDNNGWWFYRIEVDKLQVVLYHPEFYDYGYEHYVFERVK